MKKRKKMKPMIGWIERYSDTDISSILHTGESAEDYVRKLIKCARVCGEPKPDYIKVRVTEI